MGPFACPRLPVPVCSSRNHDCTWHTAHSSTSTRPLAFVLALGGLLHFRVPCPSAQYAGRGFAMNSPGVSQRHPCQELGRVHHSNGCHQGPAVCRPTEIKEPFALLEFRREQAALAGCSRRGSCGEKVLFSEGLHFFEPFDKKGHASGSSGSMRSRPLGRSAHSRSDRQLLARSWACGPCYRPGLRSFKFFCRTPRRARRARCGTHVVLAQHELTAAPHVVPPNTGSLLHPAWCSANTGSLPHLS